MAQSPKTPIEYAQAVQEQTLEAVRQSQAVVVEAVDSWAKAVEKTVPALPAVPAAQGLPSPEELVETSFAFYGKVLEAQHEFARNLVKAAAPALKTVKRASA
jgi:hypothetical protein